MQVPTGFYDDADDWHFTLGDGDSITDARPTHEAAISSGVPTLTGIPITMSLEQTLTADIAHRR